MIDLPQDLKLKRESLAKEIARKLSILIQDGSLPPGTRLIESELSDLLGVSRGPLREALRILETVSLIESEPRKGSHVAPVSRTDGFELCSLRMILEAEAVRLATLRATPEQLLILGKKLDNLLNCAINGDSSETVRLEIDFHQYIWEISGNKRLRQMLKNIIPQYRRYVSLQTSLFESQIVGISDHDEIYKAMCSHQPEKAVSLLRAHLKLGMEDAVKHLPVEQDSTDDILFGSLGANTDAIPLNENHHR